MKKNLKRALALTLLLVALGGVVTPGIAIMQPAEAIAEEGGGVSTRADIIEWRFMTIDGRLHRRLFNYSRDMWVGEWIPC